MNSPEPTGDPLTGPDPDHGGPPGPARRASWGTRLILSFVVLVSLVAGWFIATAFLPHWWAERVARVTGGNLTAGIFLGLTCGILFTAAPLLALRRAVRRRVRWAARLVWLVVAATLAAPDLTTLGIVLGGDPAARTGAQVMDDRAPGFRGATLVGAVLGVVLAALAWSVLAGRRRRRRELERLRAELRRREAIERGGGGGDLDDGDGDDGYEGNDDGEHEESFRRH